MAEVTQSGNSSNSASSSGLEMDEFLPLVKVKSPAESVGNDESFTISYVDQNTEESVEFPQYEGKSSHKLQMLLLRSRQQEIVIPFKVEKGSDDSWDDDGYIKAEVSADKDKSEPVSGITVKLRKSGASEFDEDVLTKYKSEIDIEISIDDTVEKHTSFYIRFLANDDKDDFNTGEYENVFCGCIKVYFEHTTKVGLRLTSNIESLPNSPAGYSSPPTFSEPKKSFNVANKYQNSGGMCFAVSMARTRQAFQDEFQIEALSLKLSGKDYKYSGTVISTIPDAYFGYGVGGALAANGYADLISESEIWEGMLEEGAMLQYWGNSGSIAWSTLKSAIKDELKGVNNDNFNGGHSVVFKSYIRSTTGEITGFKFYDYTGIGRTYTMGSGKMFLGANLKDSN